MCVCVYMCVYIYIYIYIYIYSTEKSCYKNAIIKIKQGYYNSGLWVSRLRSSGELVTHAFSHIVGRNINLDLSVVNNNAQLKQKLLCM